MEISLHHYLVLAATLFAIGTVGVLLRRGALVILMSIELMLNAVNLTLVAASRYHGALSGQTMAIFIMAIAAAEAAVGLAIIISIFRAMKTVNVDDLTLLKG